MRSPYTTTDFNLAEAARWRVLATQLDDPQEHDCAAVISRYVLRLEALLEDEFDSRGRDLAEKERSVKGRISRELFAELLVICAMQERGADLLTVEGVAAAGDHAVARLLTEAAESRPRTADGGFAYWQWILHHPALGGRVRKIHKCFDRPHEMAILDIDGHLVELRRLGPVYSCQAIGLCCRGAGNTTQRIITT